LKHLLIDPSSTRPSGTPAWGGGPPEPRLEPGEIHVWRVDLAALDDRLAGLLCEEERARAERMLDERARLVWMRSRGVLRALLGRYLQRDLSALRFTLGPHGKPALPGGGPAFNLSHSGDLALYALSANAEVGVDVQLERRQIDEAAIARRFLTTDDAHRLARLPPPERRTEFLRAWVRHEAALKCRGVGFGGDAGAARTGSTVGEPDVQGVLWLADLAVGAGAAAAVACEEDARALGCWEW
jgi:4'-phosphopantetheinyl transferase